MPVAYIRLQPDKEHITESISNFTMYTHLFIIWIFLLNTKATDQNNPLFNIFFISFLVLFLIYVICAKSNRVKRGNKIIHDIFISFWQPIYLWGITKEDDEYGDTFIRFSSGVVWGEHKAAWKTCDSTLPHTSTKGRGAVLLVRAMRLRCSTEKN